MRLRAGVDVRKGSLHRQLRCRYSKGSSEITELLQGETGCKEWVEAHFVVETDIEKLGDKMIECIEAKRAALGI